MIKEKLLVTGHWMLDTGYWMLEAANSQQPPAYCPTLISL